MVREDVDLRLEDIENFAGFGGVGGLVEADEEAEI